VQTRGRRRPVRRPAAGRRNRAAHRPAATPPLNLETVAAAWQRALDADDRALAAVGSLDGRTHVDVGELRRSLTHERRDVAALLERAARIADVHPAPWLSPVPLTATTLGLPVTTAACLFDLEGVLTDSGVLHASAWAETFDLFLLQLSERTGWQFIPFDVTSDYREYLDGRPRLEGVHAFLASRGIQVREDEASTLADRKREALTHRLHERGVATLPGARRFLAASGYAGLRRIVVSASTRTLPILELAGLTTLVDGRVDADLMRVEKLRARPAPDLLLAAGRQAAVLPEEAVTFTHTPAGVAAGHAAGLTVIGVGAGEQGVLLREYGAEHVVPSLGAMLPGRLG
jgi:beta-phosphoglucomutase-like phosphatase (HAD superfamily)